MAEPAANTVSADHLWGELARLLSYVGLASWGRMLQRTLWVDQSATEEDLAALGAELRLALLCKAASSPNLRRMSEMLVLALGHIEVFEWSAGARPSMANRDVDDGVIELIARPKPPDPVALNALAAARARLTEAREHTKELSAVGGGG